MAKHRLTKACEITKDVKVDVFLRDEGKCVFCGSVYGIPNAHFIPRSHCGMGVAQNILTLCPTCHHRYDNTEDRQMMKEVFREYLRSKYPDWDEKTLYYKKWRFEK